jgi:hypothetical protein
MQIILSPGAQPHVTVDIQLPHRDRGKNRVKIEKHASRYTKIYNYEYLASLRIIP